MRQRVARLHLLRVHTRNQPMLTPMFTNRLLRLAHAVDVRPALTSRDADRHSHYSRKYSGHLIDEHLTVLWIALLCAVAFLAAHTLVLC
jgi:hypothetical protein